MQSSRRTAVFRAVLAPVVTPDRENVTRASANMKADDPKLVATMYVMLILLLQAGQQSVPEDRGLPRRMGQRYHVMLDAEELVTVRWDQVFSRDAA